MHFPRPLRKGDRVALVATARKLLEQELVPAEELLRSWGLEPVRYPHVLDTQFQFAGTDANRLADVQAALDDPSIAAIWCVRGGYGTLRILDEIDFRGVRRHPKWVIGFSDLTCLLSALYAEGLACIHGPMAISTNGKTGDTQSFEYLHQMLFSDAPLTYSFEPSQPHLLRTGGGEGRLLGGNLSILSQMIGTPLSFQPKQALLFLEDLDEYLYHIDRMMIHLKRAGWLRELNGLVVGGFTDLKDNASPFGKTAEEIIAEAAAGEFPLVYGIPMGHQPANWPLLQGARASLRVSHSIAELTMRRD